MRWPSSSGEAYWSRIRLKPRLAARRIEASLPAATQNGGCGCCARRRLDHDVVELPEFSAVREALARHERLGHHLDRFLEPRLGLLRRNAEAGELVVPVALADAEIEPAAGNQIERRRLLGQQHRIVPGQHDHGGAEPQRGGAHGERGLQHQGGGDLVPAGEMMLDQEARAIAQRLGLDRVVEIIAEALPGFGAEILGAGLRRAEDSELHSGSVLKKWPMAAD